MTLARIGLRRRGRRSIRTRVIRRRPSGGGHTALSADASPFRRDTGPERPLVLLDLIGLIAVAIGLWLLGSSSSAFDTGKALNGILGPLPATFPAAISVFLAATINVGAGTVLVRLVRWAPFASISELVVGGLAGAVLLDLLLVLLLGSIGQFKPLALAVINLGLLGAGVTVRPWLAPGRRLPTDGFPRGWLLILLLWSVPLIVQLAAPVSPALDGLPTQVAPVEHLRQFGNWESLAVLPSPVDGPVHLFLGYVSLLGAVDVLTSLPAPLVVAAFALPAAILVAAGAVLLTGALTRSADGAANETSTSDRANAPARTATYWVLLTIPLTFVFLRIPAAGPLVLVFPLVCLALAALIGGGADRQGLGPSLRSGVGRRRAVFLAVALGAALAVHPIAGFLGVMTVVLFGVLSPQRARLAAAGSVGAGVIALPQLVVMLGFSAPAWLVVPAIPVGLVMAAYLGDVSGGTLSTGLRPPSRDLGLPFLIVLLLLAVLGVAVVALAVVSVPSGADALVATLRTAVLDYGVLLLPLALALALVRSLDAWRVIGSALVIGGLVLGVSALVPLAGSFLSSIAVDTPKAVASWLPWFVAIAGGLGLAAVWDRHEWARPLRVGIPLAFVLLAAVDIQPAALDAQGYEQHRYADSLAVALHSTESGAWRGYPDARTLVDAPRRALLDAVGAEIAAGRWHAGTSVLHVAPSFQQWAATPLGVFAGVMESVATADAERTTATDGGRLLRIGDLPALLQRESGRPDFAYVVIEGYGPSNEYLGAAAAAGYVAIWSDDRATLLRRNVAATNLTY